MRIFDKLFGKDILVMLEDQNPKSHAQAYKLLNKMQPSEAVRILIDGLQHHGNSEVRAECVRLLLAHDLDEISLNIVIAAIKDRSAQVRSAVIGLIAIRGYQGKPIKSALPYLIEAIKKENTSLEGDELMENVAQMNFKRKTAEAIKNTVGAKRLILEFDGPFNLEAIKKELQTMSTSKDPALHEFSEDAQKYLEYFNKL